jgi:hypothetical protein
VQNTAATVALYNKILKRSSKYHAACAVHKKARFMWLKVYFDNFAVLKPASFLDNACLEARQLANRKAASIRLFSMNL